MTGDLKVPRDTEQEDVEQEDAKREEEEEVLIVPEAPASDRTSGGETKEEEKEEIQELTPERRQNQNNAESKVPPEPETTTAPAAKEPPHVAAPNDGRRSKIIAMFVCLICIVLLLQVVIIGLIVDRNQDQEDSTRAADNGEDANNHNDGSSCNDKNVLTMAPIPEPTFVPTSSWTTPPPVPVLADGFVSIANIPGARFLKTVSNCDDCTQIVNLPNRFLFADSYYFYDALEVSSNGRIYIQNCYDGGEAGMENNCGIVNVISTDLDPSLTDTAGIWTYDATMRVQEDFSKQPLNGVLPWGAFVISWENVPLCCQDDESSNKLKVGNAQVHLYPNGRIDMCWGFGNDGILFTASIQDLISSRFYPATGQYFDSLGQTMTGLYPSYTCQTIFGE